MVTLGEVRLDYAQRFMFRFDVSTRFPMFSLAQIRLGYVMLEVKSCSNFYNVISILIF